jgi:LEA14-like dessication related protein
MKSQFLIIATTLFFLIIITCSCKSLKEPDFKGIENISLGRIGLNESTFHMDLHYFNPNKFKLKLKYAEGDAWVDDKLLGHFIMDTLIKIQAKAYFKMPVTLQMNMKMLLQNSAVLMGSKEVMLRVEGKAKVGKGAIFINYPIRYEGKQRVDSLMNRIR